MSEITVRKVENGYVITEAQEVYQDDLCYVARTDKDMIDHVTEFFFGGVLDIAEAPTSEQPDTIPPKETTEGQGDTETQAATSEQPEAEPRSPEDYLEESAKILDPLLSDQPTQGLEVTGVRYFGSPNGSAETE